MAIQKTYSMIKPDGVRNGHIGEIIVRFERAGLKIERMELKEGLEFYRKFLEHCDKVIASLNSSDIPKERKQALIDRQLDTRNMLKKRIEIIEELLR